MELLAIAIAPGLAISLYIYKKDPHNKEPKKLLLLSFLFGALCTIPAAIVQLAFAKPLNTFLGEGIVHTLVFAYVLVALSEELAKYFVLRYFAYKKHEFDEPFDGIVYSAMVGMGFATLENIGYVFQHGIGTGIMRMFLSVPAHGTFAILMGYYVGLAKFHPEKKSHYLFLSILFPVFFHGTFDFFLFLSKNGLFILGALASFYIAIRLSRKALRINREITNQYNTSNYYPNHDDHKLL
jgi:RsiW-degrading membrane proteinase PrsW (M82 family)